MVSCGFPLKPIHCSSWWPPRMAFDIGRAGHNTTSVGSGYTAHEAGVVMLGLVIRCYQDKRFSKCRGKPLELSVVPRKVVAEFSKIGNLQERLLVVNHGWQSFSHYLSVYLSICLSVYLSVCLSVYLTIYLSILPIQLSICLSIYLSVYLSICLSIYLSFYLSIYLSSYVPIFRSIYPSIYLSIYLCSYVPIFRSIYPSIYLSVCLSVCQFLFIYPTICLRIYPSQSFCTQSRALSGTSSSKPRCPTSFDPGRFAT